ncbi:MAG: ABC transporter ATP-binding protein [Propionicimonas sp.]|uniref:ABC transporter ATP-binding protein n=1 Tax=Propionicimonas sp. TaxID=1955623 RepID=UPI002B1FECA2|nr:ABC transporter ATP-binding protein [Propionicimonas sp.]MEA4944828.1 ABC transporter ATP-binding protein [Propionicimonas sp.]MEA5054174.1 ABC transporter ATP-binding protein [Propionicimonas sp.]MEA5116188.1 ABC transporter ATP-binding protein [Propionicimonas sp.]
MADIVIDNLVKVYPGSTERANDSISMHIADGEFMVLLGPSGCGKTTLLRQIAGLELPTSGGIAVGGRDITYLPVHQRNLSMVFQSYAVFPHRRVRHNIAFGLKMRKLPQAEIDQKVAWAADLLQLGPYLDRFPAQLSGGQRQRVAVARAIVVDADVLLMDEPLSNLDALLRLSFRSELKRIVGQLGTTTVYVTHDQSEALSLGDSVAVMRAGKISQLGGPLEIYNHPADTFVGGFIGSPPMNFLDGTLTPGGISIAGHLVDAPPGAPGQGAVRIGIRAESLVVHPDPAAGRVPAEVLVVEPLGAATLLTAQVGQSQVKVQVPAESTVTAGQAIHLELPPRAVRLFDPETGLTWTLS